MSHPTAPLSHPTAPWRVLLLDRDPDDPKWVLVTVALPADVRPATLDPNGNPADWPAVVEWVHASTGRPVTLRPVPGALAWHVDEEARP